MTKTEMEERCMDLIEQIVRIDKKQNRLGAINVSQKMLDKAKEKGNKNLNAIFERVLNEFVYCTDEEYEKLKRELFRWEEP